jgi:hypothetical protein
LKVKLGAGTDAFSKNFFSLICNLRITIKSIVNEQLIRIFNFFR